MKKIISFLGLFIALVLHVHASPVSVSKALQVAQRFFATTSPSNQGELKVQFTAKGTPTEPDKTQKNTNGINTQSLKTASTHALYYVINRGESNGYVVVSGDDRVQPVLAYADKGGLTEDEIEHHPSIKWMFDEYKNQIQWAINNMEDKQNAGFRRIFASTRAANYQTEIQPLLAFNNDRATRLPHAIQWGQSWPFNLYAPNYVYGNTSYPTVAGCVATAICTVLRWHQWPNKATGAVSYYWRGQKLSLNFDGSGAENKAYDWTQMPAAVSHNGYDLSNNRKLSNTQADNIGRLLRDIGYSVQMSYGPASTGGSGAYVYNAPNALTEHFGYKQDLRFLQRDNYSTKAWLKEIKSEMEDYGPVIYAGFSARGGHCFVLDGYATNGYVHVDWGWNGSENGWYLLDVLQPGSEGIGGGGGGYRSSQQMLRYLSPNRPDNERPQPKPQPQPDNKQTVDLYIHKAAKNTFKQSTGNATVTIEVGNRGNASFNDQLALSLYKEGDSQSTIIAYANATIAGSASKAVSFNINTTQLQPDTYYLVVNYLSNSTYKAIQTVAGTLTIESNSPTPTPTPTPISNEVKIFAGAKCFASALEGEAIKIPVSLSNEGRATYKGTMRLYACTGDESNLGNKTLISEGVGTLSSNVQAVFTFYTNSNFKQLKNTNGAKGTKWNIALSYVLNNKEVFVTLGDDKKNPCIGELTINSSNDNDNDNPVVGNHDVELQSVYFYQNGTYLGADYATIYRTSGNVTARVYLKSTNGYTGPIRFFVTSTSRSYNAENGLLVEKNIKINPSTNGYVDITFDISKFGISTYYLNILHSTGQTGYWKYNPLKEVPFYVRTNWYYGVMPSEGNSDTTPTQGETLHFNEAPSSCCVTQSIGLDLGNTNIENGTITGINSNDISKGMNIYPTAATSVLNVESAKATSAQIFNGNGVLMEKVELREGNNQINISHYTAGVYILKTNEHTSRFIKK